MTALAPPAGRVTAAELASARVRLLRALIEAGEARAEALRAELAAIEAENRSALAERDAAMLVTEILRVAGAGMGNAPVAEVIATLPGPEREAFGELYDELQTLIAEHAAA